MKIQLIGAISYREEKARKEMESISSLLKIQGYEVFNPFELCKEILLNRHMFKDEKELWVACMERTTANIVNRNVDACLVVSELDYNINGLNHLSYGALIEVLYAEKLEIPVIYKSEIDKINSTDLQIKKLTIALYNFFKRKRNIEIMRG